MAKVHPDINTELKQWIEEQQVFFLASAPLSADGHVNLSPRGLDSLRIVNENEIAILDLTGSGNETAAHLLENQRITVMLCAFNGAPRILRLFGTGEVVLPRHSEWPHYRAMFPERLAGERQIFRVQVSRVQTSCGFGVPLYEYQQQRDLLPAWAEKKGDDGVKEYQVKNNHSSIDGLKAPDLS